MIDMFWRRTNQDFNIRLVDVKNEKNNGLLTGVSLPPSSRAPRVSLAPKTPFPFHFKRLPRRLVILLIWLLNAWWDPLQCFWNIILRFLEQSTTRGEVGRTCCSPKSELRRQGSLFILMDLNFLIILQVKWRILSQLWFLKLVFWNYVDQKIFSC